MIKKFREVKKNYEEGLFCSEPGCDGMMEPVQSSILTDPRLPMMCCNKCGAMEPLTTEMIPVGFSTYGEWQDYDDSDYANEVKAARPEIKVMMAPNPGQQPILNNGGIL